MRLLVLLLLVGIHASAVGQDFVFVFLNKKQQQQEMPAAELDKLMEGHLANINRLAKEGKLWAAGPFDGGGGIFIFKSGSINQVNEWLSTDPGIQAERWDLEVFPYQPRIGSVCTVGEPYQMTDYSFVRFTVNLTKYSIGNVAEDWRLHNNYVKQLTPGLDVIAEGSLGEENGTILVLKGETPKEKLELDPAVQKGSLIVDIKKLHIAKGSFCEPRP